MNNNVLAKPKGNSTIVHTFTWRNITPGTEVETDYTLAQWKAFKNTYDQNSVEAPSIFVTENPRFEYNDTNVNKVVSLDGIYSDTSGNSYSGSITLPAYGSKILAKTGDIVSGGAVGVVGLRVILV